MEEISDPSVLAQEFQNVCPEKHSKERIMGYGHVNYFNQ